MPSNPTLSATARELFAEAVAACSITRALASALRYSDPARPFAFTLGDHSADLAACRRLAVIALGKAAAPMLEALLFHLRLPPACTVEGILVAPEPLANLPHAIRYFAGGHPLPNDASFAAARAALDLLANLAQSPGQTFCFFLLSGGASAMFELPLAPTLSLADTVAFHRALVHSGASIAEINCVRKHFSAVKGGRLGQAAAAIPNLSLLVSDVPPAQLDALASGPTLPDSSTVDDCRKILARYHLLPQIPAPVQRLFTNPSLPETPKPGAFPARAVTLLSSEDLAEAARRAAEARGFHAIIDNTPDDWDFRDAAAYLLARMRELRQTHPCLCLISIGELTVAVAVPNPGIGGRNQHFVLYAASQLTPADEPVAILSAGSDGIDGNSPFAGAALDGATLRAVPADRIASALARFDSSTLLDSLGATLHTGPTGNNLRDLRLLLTT